MSSASVHTVTHRRGTWRPLTIRSGAGALPASASDLARAEQVTPQAVGPTVAVLEERGLVMRSPDPKDGRRVLLSVTEPGLEALRDKRSAVVERMAVVLAEDFSEAELETLHAAALLIERLGEQL